MNVGSWLIITILLLLLIVTFARLLLFHWDIKNMTKQLDDIIENFGTNELVYTNTHNQTMNQFTAKINQLIHLFKQDQQHTLNREKNLKQEITNISHDFRTPVTSIKGVTELLSEPSLSETQRKEFLTIIEKKIDNLTMKVDLFYELSQLDSSDKQLIMEKQSLDHIVVDTMLLFYGDFEKKQIKVEMDERTVSPILADKKAVDRIVANIIQNAITDAKSYFKISFVEEEEVIRLRAVNDVEEINVTSLQRIFDRTVRLDSSRTGNQLGLGLHIVQQLVTKQGGTAVADVHDNEYN